MSKYAFALPIRQEHIVIGIRNNIRRCPIALAAAEAFAPAFSRLGGFQDCWVNDNGEIWIFAGKATFWFRALWADCFVARFDNGQHVAPQTLYYELVACG